MYLEKYLVEEQPRENTICSNASRKKSFIFNFMLVLAAVFGICCANALVEVLARAL